MYLFASVNGAANNGGGFIYEYTPAGVQSIFASGLSRPRGVAFDHFGAVAVNTSGNQNTGCGATTLKSNTTGNDNTAIGFDALFSATTASENTAIGSQALYYNTTSASVHAFAVGNPDSF